MSEIFLQNEDNLNSILVNFKNLLKSFATLSRDKIENILLNANSMIKEGENNLRIMEEEINKKANKIPEIIPFNEYKFNDTIKKIKNKSIEKKMKDIFDSGKKNENNKNPEKN